MKSVMPLNRGKLLTLMLVLTGTCHGTQDADTCLASDGSCEGSLSSSDQESLIQTRARVATEELGSEERTTEATGVSLAVGEYIVQPLEKLPTNMGDCKKWATGGGCKKWLEFAVCGKSEADVYKALDAAFQASKQNLNTGVIIGARSDNSPSSYKTLSATGKKCAGKCTSASHKWNKKGYPWSYKCMKPSCKDCMQCNGLKVKDKKGGKSPYVSAQPVTCSKGSPVQFLVHKWKDDDKLIAADTAVQDLGLTHAFDCATEHWIRQIMSEQLEQYPSPYLLNSFPDAQQQINQNTKNLFMEMAKLSQEVDEDDDEDDEEEDEDDGEDVPFHLQRDGEALLEEQALAARMADIRAQIDKKTENMKDVLLRLKRRFGHDHGIALGPRFIRMTFHDAADFKNMISGNGTVICDAKHPCGGVDFKLHTALLSVGLNQKSLSVTEQSDEDEFFEEEDENGEAPIGDPNHNKGLTNARQWVYAWGSHQFALGKADILVLGAHVAVQTWLSGPEITYRKGRVDADHRKSKILEAGYCTHEDCMGQNAMFLTAPVAEPVADGMFCPATTTLAGLQSVLGLTTREMVALHGSHSIGGIIRCSGMGNTGQGAFCGGVKCCPPGMKDVNGQCVCIEKDCRTVLVGMNGASFDGTPNKLDNMYYKQLDAANFYELPECNDGSGKSINDIMPGMRSTDQALFICMKHKGYHYKASEGNATWDEVVKHGCADRAARSYGGNVDPKKEKYCRHLWSPGGKGIKYPKRDWCGVDACMDACQKKPSCGIAPLSEIGVMMSKFQNKDYGKVCEAEVETSSVKVVQSVLDGIKMDKYKHSTIEDDVTLQKKDGKTVNVKGMMLFKMKPGGKVKMVSEAQRRLDGAKKKGDKLDSKFVLIFSDPDDPKCNQCTEPGCAKDALEALENALGMVKPDDGKSIRDWLNDVLASCKACKEQCLVDDAKKNGKAQNTQPEWCLQKTGESFCARGGVNHECSGDHKFGIKNHADGRRTLIWNTLRWSRFRGQTRRIAMMPADWAQLGNKVQRDAVKEFAGDNAGFLKTWSKVFQKTSEAGTDAKDLKTCTATSCQSDGSTITCANALNPGTGVESLKFDQCSGVPPKGICSLRRNFGVKGVFVCGNAKELFCTTDRGRKNLAQAAKELAYGSDHETCWKDMLNTDA